MENHQFNQEHAVYLERLKQYVPVVSRVHGKSHPEFYDVEKIWKELEPKLTSNVDHELALEDFAKLREITRDYTVPGDVCETYEAVYKMLEELDHTYFQ